MVIKNQVFGATLCGLKYSLCCLLAVLAWATYLTSLCLILYKMGVMLLFHWVILKIMEVLYVMSLVQHLVPSKCSLYFSCSYQVLCSKYYTQRTPLQLHPSKPNHSLYLCCAYNVNVYVTVNFYFPYPTVSQ